MQHVHRFPLAGAIVAVLLGGAIVAAQQNTPKEHESGQAAGQQSEDGFRFRTGVELVNVTATVTDDTGRFVPNLRKEDFVVYEDGAQQTITHFNADRVPVSLGIAVDTSGSMAGEKFEHAQAAL